MIIDVIETGSGGNACYISDRYSGILLDAGTSFRALNRRLAVSELEGVLITHEHGDHCKAVPELIRRGIPVYMSEGTRVGGGFGRNVNVVKAEEAFQVGSFMCMGFDVKHDTAEPLGFLCSSIPTNDKVLYITDAGRLPGRFKGITHLLIECNFDDAILESRENIPDVAKHRIRNNHLSLTDLENFMNNADIDSLQEIHLMHMSDGSSHEEMFIDRIEGQTGLPVYAH